MAVKRGGISVVLPCLVVCADVVEGFRHRVPDARSESEVFSTAAANCKHREPTGFVAQTVLVETWAPASKETFECVFPKCEDDDHATVATVAAAADEAVTERREALSAGVDVERLWSNLWRTFDPRVLLNVVRGRDTLSARGNDDLYSLTGTTPGQDSGEQEVSEVMHGYS